MLSTSTPTPIDHAESSTLPSRPTGKGAKDKQQNRFRNSKNKKFSESLKATVFTRLKISDPTNIGQLPTFSNVVTTRIPIAFKGIPALITEVWNRMKAIGTRPFANIATDANKAIFMKVCLLIFEAKVCYAQRKAQCARFDLPTQYAFTDMQLRHIRTVSQRLPFPLAIALEHLGRFQTDDQQVVPCFSTVTPVVASGAISLSRSDIRTLVRELREPVQINQVLYAIARELRELPQVIWREEEHAAYLTAETVQFWAGGDIWDPLPPGERDIFLQIIASMESKKGFILQVDIEHGEGSAAAAVRFHENFDAEEIETLYYMNTRVTTYEEQIAPALMYGYEFQTNKFSRFCGDYDEPLIHGSANQSDARQALVWADVS